ncbi:MAG: MFS transporter, partial [Sciscionella sp.]|nr:MFS transporter [Sciscionella sp.]
VLLSFAGPDAWGGWVIMAQLGLAATGPLCIPAAIAEVASSAPARLAATGQGALNASRQAGAALGVAVLGTMATLSAAGVVLAGFAAVTLVLVAFTRR